MANEKLDWDQFALLLIDVQEDFWSGEMESAFPDFRQNVSHLLTLCREQGIEVIHVRGRFSEDKSDWMPVYKLGRRMPCVENTSGVELLDEAREQAGELVINKQSFDGFLSEQLDPHLQHMGRRFLLTAGLVTSICVFLTSVSAMQMGYLVAMIEDCCADEPAAHKHTLSRYDFMFEKTGVAGILEQHPKWMSMLEQLYGKQE